MGRAIVRNPRVFLFDEPLSNLDAKLRVKMRAEIRELHQRLSSTSIYVTHDQIEAMTMGDEIVVMNEGRIEQIGVPLEVYDRPESEFVAEFIGSPAMNLLHGIVQHMGKAKHVVTEDGVRLPLPSHIDVSVGTAVTYGVRPAHLRLSNDVAALYIEVTVVEPTGAETHIVGRLGTAEIRASFNERRVFPPGQWIAVLPDLDCLHLFDAHSGKRIV